MSYIIYKTTGEIVSIVQAVADKQPSEDISPLLFLSDMDEPEYANYYVESGGLVSKGTAPTPGYIFDYDSKTWVEGRDLLEAKQSKIREFTKLAVVEEFQYDGNIFRRSEAFAAISAYVAMNNSTPPGYSGVWLDSTDSIVSIPDWVSFYAAYAITVQNAINKLQSKISEINACTTLSALDLVTW